MKIYDITVPIGSRIAVWPGDAPYEFTWNQRVRDGGTVNLGSVTMSVHTGTHADAPYHIQDTGATIDACDPQTYCGEAVVVDVRGRQVIRCEDVTSEALGGATRVLFRTDAWIDHRRFPISIPVMEASLPAYLQTLGVILVGVDVPSVDQIDSKKLENHHALGAAGIRILESVTLTDVPPGHYELIALPLRLVGSDASPVRAILRR